MTSTAERTPEALTLQPRPDFVETPNIGKLTERALDYLGAGFPVHFRGPTGTGKTTLALNVAAQLGRPVMLIAGDDEFGTSDLVGGSHGYRYRKVFDNFISSVKKYEEESTQRWVDHRLTVACRQGLTLVYDEFTRARPEANNILLGVLEEQLLILPNWNEKESYVKVDPNFRAIFTSNPAEYAGVHAVQDALGDRLVCIDVDYYDRETEIAITAARSGLSEQDAAKIVDVVRGYRDSGEYDQTPTMRSAIMIAQVAAMRGMTPSAWEERFVQVCLDMLESKIVLTSKSRERRTQQHEMLRGLIEEHCDSRPLADVGQPAAVDSILGVRA